MLLNEFGRIGEHHGWIHEHIEATADTRVAGAIAALSRRVLLELSLKERVKVRARTALGALRAFVKVHVPPATAVPSRSTSNPGPVSPTPATSAQCSARSAKLA